MDLDEFPAYTAISHTWGRWREHGKPQIKLEGVPWPIPQTGLFDVQIIPQSLQRAEFHTRYIWLDLVCIPQDGSDIAIQEIGRQAGIFRNASRAIAWLHDVADLSCLNAMLRWFTLSLILFEPGSSDAKRRDEMKEKELQRIAHKPSGLLAPGQGFRRISHGLKLNPRFTSLWTLQEVCLRPDMLLASSDWDTLSVDGTLRVLLGALLLVYSEVIKCADVRAEANRPSSAHVEGKCQQALKDRHGTV